MCGNSWKPPDPGGNTSCAPKNNISATNTWPGSTPRPFSSSSIIAGLKVGPITELRKRLNKAGAEMHVVKNSLFRLAVKEAGVADLGATLTGQLAVVTGPARRFLRRQGRQDFQRGVRQAESPVWLFEEPAAGKRGHHGPGRFAVHRSPARQVAGRDHGAGHASWPTVINTPGTQLARVLQARVDKGE